MKNNLKNVLRICTMIVCVLALTVVSLFVGKCYGEQKFRKMLIDKDFAEYNSKTGAWQLKNIQDFVPNLNDDGFTHQVKWHNDYINVTESNLTETEKKVANK